MIMLDGIFNVYKEKGYTSHDVVAKLRGIAGQRKIGHTGTLDPDAEGVLPVCLGKATRVCDVLADKSKTYRTVLLLGRRTDTQDISGACLEEKETAALTEAQVREAVESFQGVYMQTPPMYSALKVNGRKLYELAREGKTVERKARPVEISRIRILKMELPRVWMEVDCSKGTYIRTLCDDIGRKLGVGGCMEELLRTRVGEFSIGDSLRLSELEALREQGGLESRLMPVDSVFASYRRADAGAEKNRSSGTAIRSGFPGVQKDVRDRELVRVYDREGRFVALYRYDEKGGVFRTEKMFFSRR